MKRLTDQQPEDTNHCCVVLCCVVLCCVVLCLFINYIFWYLKKYKFMAVILKWWVMAQNGLEV